MISKKRIDELHAHYAQNVEQQKLVQDHCKVVSEIALWCARNTKQTVDMDLLEAACLLHDIGSYGFMHDSFERRYYTQHALLGSKLLEQEGVDKRICEIIETHVLLGVAREEVIENGWKIPIKDYTPTSIEAEILCYADRYHAKKPVLNSFESFHKKLLSFAPDQARKFTEMSEEFGIPDLKAISKKYGHPIK